MDDLVKRLLGVSLTAFPADIGGLTQEAAERIKQLEQGLETIVSGLKVMREEWLEENAPSDDCDDCDVVTPFDQYLYVGVK